MQKMLIFVPVIIESKIDQGSLFNAFHKYPFLDETESYKILINIYFFHNQDLSVSIQNLQWSSFLIWSQLIIRLFLEKICHNSFPEIFCFKLEKSYETSKENITKYCVLQVQANSIHTLEKDVLTKNCSDN